MILVCSRGCEIDTETIDFWDKVEWQFLKPGDSCPEEISYDRMTGSTYCRRILKVKEEDDESNKS